MRRSSVLILCLASTVLVSACTKTAEEEVDRAVQDVINSDRDAINDIMIRAANPNEAAAYFKRELSKDPDNIDFRRGLAVSLIRGGRAIEGMSAWKNVVEHPQSTSEDKVELADASIRAGEWKTAEAALNSTPPTHETFKRYRLEAMIADSKQDWPRADSYYETAVSLTTRPASVLNNWGYSKLSRGDNKGAERLFAESLTYDQGLFTAKNNLVLARAKQRKYQLPVIPMSQVEEAQLLHTMALAAIKQGDVETGRGLLEQSIEVHPQYFEPAVRALDSLEKDVAL